MGKSRLSWGIVAATLLLATAACSTGDDDGSDQAGHASQPATTAPEQSPTIDELLAAGKPLSIAHAGGEVDYPHSTLFGYGESVKAGADVLEMDVQLSKDGTLMIIHDLTVDRTTEGTGNVADMTAAELQALDNGYDFVPSCWGCPEADPDDHPYRGVRTGDTPPPDGYEPDDFAIPTLAEVAERFPGQALDIEIKGGPNAEAAADALAAELDDLGREDSAIVVSFDQAIIERFHAAAPDVAISPGVDGLTKWFLEDTPLDGYAVFQVPPDYEGVEVLTPVTLSRAHDQGFAIWVWMNTDQQESLEYYSQLVGMGVDGLIAGRPEKAAEAIATPN